MLRTTPPRRRSYAGAVVNSRAIEFGTELLAQAGITVNGPAPWDFQLLDERFFTRVIRDGTLACGEGYMDGQWDAPALDQCIDRFLRARSDAPIRTSWVHAARVIKSRILNLQGIRRAFHVGEQHYDIGNDLYQKMLCKRMVYTCAYFQDTDDLDEAQEAKLDLVCRKIGLDKGMRVLELGCGWGSFAKFAAERYGAHVTGLTVSKEQVALGTELCKGLPVDLQLRDYREASGTYDAVVSIGIMEHVGHKNYRTYMEVANRCLAPGGVAFVHTIANNHSRETIEPWIDKYIFPNAQLPSLAQLGAAIEGIFVLEDLHNIGEHYDTTLMAWQANFDRAWPELRGKYGERFYRMWKYYLMCSAASFRSRFLQLYQMVLTKTGTSQPDCRKS